MPIVPAEVCRDLDRGSRLEWLQTNGIGGYAMGTASNLATRRYHALLVASLRPPVQRFVVLSRVEETLSREGGHAALGVARYAGAIAPAGHELLSSFELDPTPTWTWEALGARLERRLVLPPGENTVILIYRSDRPTTLRVRPFVAMRDHHALMVHNDVLDRHLTRGDDWARLQPYRDRPAITLHHSDGLFEDAGHWYHGHEYAEERARGQDFREDLYTPGVATVRIGPDMPAFLVATLEDGGPWTWSRVAAAERAARRKLAPWATTFADRLATAADAFRARRADGRPTIVAGFPWFTDWGRDTMISLPGLLVARGLLDEARAVLAGFLAHLDRGLIPNRFPDEGQPPEYNTADATLWTFEAMRALAAADPDHGFLRDVFYPRAREILEHHRRGTHHGIHVDPDDGLLAAGAPGVQLTWMDAKAGDWVVTPRQGKPVEIQALWHHALCLMAGWAGQLEGPAAAAAWASEAERVARSFRAKFWNEAAGCLFDRLDEGGGADPSLRPNQLFAVSLGSPLLPTEQQRAVVDVVQRHLLTPYGLRTLAPSDPAYRPRYEGDRLQRDGAYHQGTVWPWLLGPYCTALLRAYGRGPEQLAAVAALLAPLERHLDEACLGQVGEIFDGNAPHRAAGAPAQAWSVAELLRVLVTELGGRC